MINLGAGAYTMTLRDDGLGSTDPDGTQDAGFSHIAFDAGAEDTEFKNPNASLTINDLGGSKTISVQGLDAAWNADLIINDDAGDDNIVVFQTNTTDIAAGDLDVTAGSIDFSAAFTTTGSATLNAGAGGIHDTSGDNTAKIIATSLNASAGDGTVGANIGAGGNPLAISVNNLTTETRGTNTSGSQWINEADGLHSLNLDAGTGNIMLQSGGEVQDDDGANDVTATDLIISVTAGGGIGLTGNRVGTTVTNLDVSNVGGGGIFITNTGSLTTMDLGGADTNSVSGVGGGGEIRAYGPLTLTGINNTIGGFTYTAFDNLDDGNDVLLIDSGTTVTDGMSLTFNGGDAVTFHANGTSSAIAPFIAINVDVLADSGDDEMAGGEVNIPDATTLGLTGVGTTRVTITGGYDGDEFNIVTQADATVSINGGDPIGLIQSSGDLLNVTNGSANGTIQLNNEQNSGSVFVAGLVPVTFTSIERLQLGGIDYVLPTQRPTISLLGVNDSGLSDLDNVTNFDDGASRVPFTVTAELGTTVRIRDGNTVINGPFVSTGTDVVSLTLGNGTHLLSVEVGDANSNVQFQSEELVVTIDRAIPAAPTGLDLLTASDTSDPAGTSGSVGTNADNITRINQPAIAGTGEPNAKIRIFSGAELVGQGVVNTNGTWEITLEPVADRVHSLTTVQEDLAGNISVASAVVAITVDTLPPQRPTMSLNLDSGMSAQDNVTNTPNDVNFTLTAEAGSHVFVKDGETVLVDFTIVGTMATVALNLVNGIHLLSAESFDAAGNRSVQSDELAVTIDRIAPLTPTAPDLLASSDDGVSSTDNITTKMQPAFSGTGEPNSIVRVFVTDVNGFTELVGQSVVKTNGIWEFTAEPLDNGIYTVTSELEDVAGNISAQSAPLNNLIIDPHETNDTIAAATVLGSQPLIVLNGIVLHDGNDADIFSVTARSTGAQIIRSFDAVGTVNIDVRDALNNVIGTSTAIVGGQEIVLPVVAQQRYYMRVTSDDEERDVYNLEVENVAAPQPETPILKSAHDSGMFNNDNVTNTASPAFSIQVDLADFADRDIPIDQGLAANGAEIILAFTNTDSGVQTTFEANGVGGNRTFWSATGVSLPDGVYTVTAWTQIRDGAGTVGRGSLSSPQRLTIDTTPPQPPALAPNLLDSSDTGMSNSDNVTSKMSPTFDGVGEANSKIRILANGVLVGQGVVGTDYTDGIAGNGQGSWHLTVGPLTDGAYVFTFELEDVAGNISLASPSDTIQIDATQPDTPYLDLLNDTGRSAIDNITGNNLLQFEMIGNDTTNGSDNPFWHDVTYRLYWRTGDASGVGSGTGEVLVYDSFSESGDFTTLGHFIHTVSQDLNDPAGTPFPDGFHHFTLVVEDRAGNISHESALSVVIDTQAFLGDGNLHPGSDSGVQGFPTTMIDRVTSEKVPRFVGVAEANNIVTVTIDGVSAGTAVAVPLSGNDAFQPPNPPNQGVEGNYRIDSVLNLADGQHSALFTFEDPSGNRVSTQPLLFIVDTQGPRVTDIDINNFGNAYDIFNHRNEGSPDTLQPTPLVHSLVISFSDLPSRMANFLSDAIFLGSGTADGHFTVRGDANGIIAIQSIAFTPQTVEGGQAATGYVALRFATPLPDDRYTLTVADSITDIAGNVLDGEVNTNEPLEVSSLPSGDGVPGGDFVARFTIDSRPEIGVWASGIAWVDTNGNTTFDPHNVEASNRDIVYSFGNGNIGSNVALSSDDFFAGNFAHNGVADGFDKLAVYGSVGQDASRSWRFLVDTDNDGVPDVIVNQNTSGFNTANLNGLPVAGNFTLDHGGDEVGIFNGTSWLLDTDGDYILDSEIMSDLRGYPIVGDFDGDGKDDLGTWSADVFQFDLAANGLTGAVDAQISFGFAGIRERPLVADLNQDGIDDIGLWSPDLSGIAPDEGAKWFFLLSNDPNGTDDVNGNADGVLGSRMVGSVSQLNHAFQPVPFGQDLYMQFGTALSLPIIGNFDPPAVAGVIDLTEEEVIELFDRLDVNRDGHVSPLDALIIINEISANGSHSAFTAIERLLDVNNDGTIAPIDALAIINYLNENNVFEPEREGSTVSNASDITKVADGQFIAAAKTMRIVFTPIATASTELESFFALLDDASQNACTAKDNESSSIDSLLGAFESDDLFAVDSSAAKAVETIMQGVLGDSELLDLDQLATDLYTAYDRDEEIG